MITKTQYDLIYRLKQKPAHGRADRTNTDIQKEFEAWLKTLEKDIPNADALLNTYTESLKNLDTANARTAMGMNKLIGIHNKFSSQISELVKNITYFEETNKALGKTFGLTGNKAKVFANDMRNIAVGLDIGEDKLFGYVAGLKDLTSGFISSNKINMKFRDGMIKGQAIMQNQLEVTAAAAEGYEAYASTFADSSLDALAIQKKLADTLQNETGLDSLYIQSTLTEEIGNLAADVQMHYSKMPGSLELAVLKSKQLGMNMETLYAAGKNMLNIESSIGQELEYQLISGQRLLTADKKSLTNEYRLATIRGDGAKQAELMTHFLKEQSGVLKNNIYAREKAAQLFGINEGDLMKSLRQTELISKLGADRLMALNQGDVQKVVAEIRKQPTTDQQKAEREKLIGELIKNSDKRSTAEITNDHLASIDTYLRAVVGKDININTKAGEGQEASLRDAIKEGIKPIEKLMTSFDKNVDMFGAIGISEGTIKAISTPISELVKIMPGIGTLISDAVTKFSELITINLPNASAKPVNDSLIIPDRGPILRPAKNDVIAAFRPNDVVHNTLNSMGSNNSAASIDYNRLAMAITSAMKNVKVEATLKADTVFGETYLNRRNIS